MAGLLLVLVLVWALRALLDSPPPVDRSGPVVVDDVVVVGSGIGDNRRVELERGAVRGFDVRTGELRWAWDRIPREPDDPGWEEWAEAGGDGGARTTGAGDALVAFAPPEWTESAVRVRPSERGGSS